MSGADQVEAGLGRRACATGAHLPAVPAPFAAREQPGPSPHNGGTNSGRHPLPGRRISGISIHMIRLESEGDAQNPGSLQLPER